jgi:MtN3 and saliva related transmembrane protein
LDNYILIIGLVAAAFTTFAFLPQSIKAIRTKHTKDISLSMLIMLLVGIAMWVIYGIFIKDIPLISANSISFVLMVTMLFLKLKYG